MKLEKMLKTLLLSSALLISLAAAAGAAEIAAPAAEALPAAAEAAPASVAPAGNCDRAADSPLYQSAVEKGSTNSLLPNCGTCSVASCSGAARGQMCWTGGVHGQWGRCNVYTGNVCSSGGFECSCGTGPIP